jgi:hypothetical protein
MNVRCAPEAGRWGWLPLNLAEIRIIKLPDKEMGGFWNQIPTPDRQTEHLG